ncbi:MAG: hypothetical protein QOH88_479 [Verrucomicrobiota bacterium]
MRANPVIATSRAHQSKRGNIGVILIPSPVGEQDERVPAQCKSHSGSGVRSVAWLGVAVIGDNDANLLSLGDVGKLTCEIRQEVNALVC